MKELQVCEQAMPAKSISFHNSMVALLLLLLEGHVVHVNHIPEEISKDNLVAGHLRVTGEVVDVNDEIPVPGTNIPDHVEVEELQAQGTAEPACDLVDEISGRHDGVLEPHVLVVLLGRALIGEIGYL